MKKLLTFALALVCASGAAFAAPTQFKHMAKNVSCEACHNSSAPATPAKAKSCNKCHNYDQLAEKTSKLALNPHDSHAGQLRCTLCHKEHSESVVHCKTCHKNGDPKFDFKTP